MTDQDPADQPAPEYRIEFDHFDTLEPDALNAGIFFLQERQVLALMVKEILSNLPNPASWRLTITADLVQTVGRLQSRADDDAYTTDRGAGSAAAKTFANQDGTYEIVISFDALFPSYMIDDPDKFEAYVSSIGRHLALHESGHPLLDLRGEDQDSYQDLTTGTKTEHAWRKHLAAHIDDFRIEKMTNPRVASPLSQVTFLGDAITHMRGELTASRMMADSDSEVAATRSLTAINDLLRVMTYLAAELGTDHKITAGLRPDSQPEGWAEYVEEVWDAWALQLDLLKPADEPMTSREIAAVLDNLCKMVVLWATNIVGFDWEMFEDNSWQAFWGRVYY